MAVNSKEYWNDRFTTTSWTDNFGIQQSQLFADILIKNIPSYIIHGSESLLDVGCALGQLCASWRDYSTCDKVVGYDLSDVACKKAGEMYPEIDFVSKYPVDKFDIVTCSNLLEHMEDFFPVLSRMTETANKFIVILVPFDAGMGGEHVRNFKLGDFPDKYKKFNKIKDDIIDVFHPVLWNGRQELVIYKKIVD